MYDLFIKENTTVEDALLSIEKWKNEVFSIVELDVKKYFAEKVIVYFDNYTLFKKEAGFHNNLMEALALSADDMFNSPGVFKEITARWIYEENNHFLIIKGLTNALEKTLTPYGFRVVEKGVTEERNKKEELNFSSWLTLVFNVELVNFSKGWFNHIPNLEERCRLQTEYILLTTQFNKSDMTLLEKINFEKNIRSHNSYNTLYEKILKVMPKIQSSLEEEYKEEKYKDLEAKIVKNKVRI